MAQINPQPAVRLTDRQFLRKREEIQVALREADQANAEIDLLERKLDDARSVAQQRGTHVYRLQMELLAGV